MSESDYFIDANIFLRVFVKENEKHYKECFNLLKLVKNGKIKAFTSSLVIAEVNWVLNRFYQTTKKHRIRLIKSILKFNGLKIRDESNPLLGIHFYEKYNIKFIDALIAANNLIYKNNIAIISYDKDFDKLNVKRIEPKKIIKLK